MFVIVVALNTQGISGEIANLLGTNNTIWVYGYTSFLTCNLINNIPMSILFTNIASSLTGRVYLEAGKEYVFSCDSDASWGNANVYDSVPVYVEKFNCSNPNF